MAVSRWIPALGAVALTLYAPRMFAQTEVASLQGLVTGTGQVPLPSATVTVRDLNAGNTRTIRTGSDGFYFVGGLAPSVYEVRVTIIGYAAQTDSLRLHVAGESRLDFSMSPTTAQLTTVQVTAQRNTASEARDPQIATTVAVGQINNEPQNNRNFLDLTKLVPGTQQPIPGTGGQSNFGYGAATLDQVNVVIDGASYKNDVLNGGVAGQTTTRGNLFPQNAIQEFVVLANNFNAEYQYSTSGVVQAATQSGGNEWHGSIFAYGEAPWMIRRDFQSTVLKLPPSNIARLQDGVSLGGPIIKDKLHIFASYEGTYTNYGTRIIPGPDSVGTARSLNPHQYLSTTYQNFRQANFFGKLSYDVTPDQHLELTQTFNNTTDPGGYGNVNGNQEAVQTTGTNLINDVNTTTLRDVWSPGHWLNEAQLEAQFTKWNPQPINPNLPQLNYSNLIVLGGGQTYQNFEQNTYRFHDDLTYSGFHALGDHVFKGGVTYAYDHYHIFKELNYNPQFNFQDPGKNDTIPGSALIGYGNPNVSADNGEVGVFLQDNWTVTSRLNINLGIRWDYESNEFANTFVWPNRALEDSILAIRDSHGHQMISANDFNNGGQRPPFTGAFQPRASMSFDLTGQGRYFLFGNWGIFYDRDNYYYLSNERYNLQWNNINFNFVPPGTTPAPGQTVWNNSYLSKQGLQGIIASGQAPPPQLYLNPDNLRPPWSTNFSGGLREVVGRFAFSESYLGSRGFNGFTYIWGNRDFSLPGFSFCYAGTCSQSTRSIVVACNCVESWYDAMILKVERPVTPAARWGGWISYTLSWAYNNGADGGGNVYSLDRPTPGSYPRHPSPTDQRSVLSGNAVVNLPLDFVVSGIVTFSSGSAYDLSNCKVYNNPTYGCYIQYSSFYVPKHDFLGISNAFAYYQDDIRIQKLLRTIGSQRVGLTLDVFNVFNLANRACPNTSIPASGPPNIGILNCAGFNNEGRTYQAGVKYDF
jgi:hypothetical protein